MKTTKNEWWQAMNGRHYQNQNDKYSKILAVFFFLLWNYFFTDWYFFQKIILMVLIIWKVGRIENGLLVCFLNYCNSNGNEIFSFWFFYCLKQRDLYFDLAAFFLTKYFHFQLSLQRSYCFIRFHSFVKISIHNFFFYHCFFFLSFFLTLELFFFHAVGTKRNNWFD